MADTTGAAIPNAPVVATRVETGIKTTVNANGVGEYVFPVLDPGSYTVEVKVQGFQAVTQKGIVLSASQNVHVNFSLAVGAETQAVSVDATITMVDTREAQLAMTVDTQRITELPLNGRNSYDLVALVPGISNYSSDLDGGSRSGTTFVTNGLGPNMNSYYLDGTFNMAFWHQGGNFLPNPDALQEFRVLTSNFDAEFGRAPGAVVNAITRSGTNHYHGAVYDYIRNNLFNAAPWGSTGGVPRLVRNHFGATVGGPVTPKNDHIFFFFAYEGLRIRQSQLVLANTLVTPTALERTGDFSQTPGIASLAANARFKAATCGNSYVICPTNLDPVVQKLLQFIPVGSPDAVGHGNAPQQSTAANTNQNEYLARADWHINAKHQIQGTFFDSKATSLQPTAGSNQIFSYSGASNWNHQVNSVIAHTWMISPTALNVIRGFYMEERYILANAFGNDHMLGDFGSKMPGGGPVMAPAFIKVTGYWNMGSNQYGPNDASQLAFGLSDTFNLVRGRHAIKAGGSDQFAKSTGNGIVQANGIFTVAAVSTGTYSTSNSIADFLTGRISQLTQSTNNKNRVYNYDPAFFAQDNWQVASRLNLNLGIRWELYVPYQGGPLKSTWVPNQQSTVFPTAPIGMVFEGDKGIPGGVYNNPHDNFAPRLGFAYDVWGNGQTSLRGGIGIFYVTYNLDNYTALVGQPNALATVLNNVSAYGANTGGFVNSFAPGVAPFPYIFTPGNAKFTSATTAPVAMSATRLGSPTPRVTEFNMTIEQQLAKSWAFSIGYVGNVHRRLYLTRDLNPPTYAPGAAIGTAGILARRPYQPYKLVNGTFPAGAYAFAAINTFDPVDNGSYNSLQMILRGHAAHFDINANYVYSKAMNYDPPNVDPSDIKKNYGVVPGTMKHSFNVSILYHLPNTNWGGVIGRQVLSGWQINDITNLQSGSAFNVTSGTDTNLDGTNNDRPDLIGDPYTHAEGRQAKINAFLNPKAFALPTGPYGNMQANSLYGPGKVLSNISMFKVFRLHGDNLKLQYRVEAFNAFGNVNLGSPISNWANMNKTPQITSYGDPRIWQMALKFIY